MEEFKSNGGSSAVRSDEQLFMMVQLPSTGYELIIHRWLL